MVRHSSLRILRVPVALDRLAALDLVPVDQLDRRRHHAHEVGPLDRLEALAAAAASPRTSPRPNSIVLPPVVSTHERVEAAAASAPRRGRRRPSSSLMPITPLPTPDRMLISSSGKWMTWPVARRQEDALLVPRHRRQHDLVAVVQPDVAPARFGRGDRGTAPAASAASGPGRSRPAGTAPAGRRSSRLRLGRR